MKVTQLASEEVAARTAVALGLPNPNDLFTDEGVCASLRRAASFLCPATPRQLVDAVRDALTPLAPQGVPSRDDLMDRLGLLVAAGDLLELREESQRQTRRLFLGPPSYVSKSHGQFLLLGVRPFGAPLVAGPLAEDIAYEGYLRTLTLAAADAPVLLAAAGLRQITRESWLKSPRAQAAEELLTEYRRRLAVARPAGQIEGLSVIDPAARVDFYRGRWRPRRASDDGDFIGRRPQAYGADLWCFVRIEDGQPKSLLDLPIADRSVAGRFEAWRIQAALDAERRHPQVARVRSVGGDETTRTIDLFGPLPSWAERFLTLIGLPGDPQGGALMSYRLPREAVPEVSSFLTNMLWVKVTDEGTSQ